LLQLKTNWYFTEIIFNCSNHLCQRTPPHAVISSREKIRTVHGKAINRPGGCIGLNPLRLKTLSSKQANDRKERGKAFHV
jgi:hypothetical protein